MKITKYITLFIIFSLIIILYNLSAEKIIKLPYVDELKGRVENSYIIPISLNGDSLILLKLSDVDRNDFEKFTQNYEMKPMDNFSDLTLFNFHEECEWWPTREVFEKGEKFYQQQGRSELFVFFINDTFYLSRSTW